MKQKTSSRGERLERRAVELVPWLAGLSAAGALIHVAVVPEHLEEYRPFGMAFSLMALAQAAWAIAALAREPERKAGVAPGRLLLISGIVGNAAIVLLWALSRTTGLPIGPEAGTPEAVGALDVLATVYEVAFVAGAALLLRGRSLRVRLPERGSRAIAGLAAAMLTFATFLAIAAGSAAHAGHDAAEAASAHGPHLLLLSAGVISFGAWAWLDIRENGLPRFSWRVRPDEIGSR